MSKQKALFLDRDGTLIIDKDYPRDPDQVELMDGSIEFLSEMQQLNFALVVVSNQSGIGRGIIHPDEAKAVHERFLQLFKEHGVTFAGAYHCPHGPDDDCSCRKPKPGMLLQAEKELNLDLSQSYMIGDKLADVAAGHNAGCKGILFRQKLGDKPSQVKPDAIANSWADVKHYILSTLEIDQ